ncbi:MAG: tetratricopeptide repeat protein [Novosphingobium sp.]|uniref:tetratricopeptide repeat protein n=1 Tax=Novosphingobium sp. TaxID=1874826 RepID=UPI0030181DAE
MKRALTIAALLATAACSRADPAAQLAAAQHAFAAEDYAAARSDVLAALDADSDNREMLLLLARTQLRLGDGDGAQSTLSRLEDAGVHTPELMRLKAEAAILRGQPEAALTLLGQGGDAEAWRLRAAAHGALDDAPAALEALRRGMAVGGQNYDLVHDYAAFLIAAQDFEGAGVTLQTLKALGPKRLDTLMIAGSLATRQGRLEDAKREFSAAADAFPARVEPLTALASLADMSGQVDAALALVARAAKIAPAHLEVIELTVQLASEKGDWETVRKTLVGQETSLDPRSGNGMTYAEALLRLGHPEQARAMFAQALLLSPQNPYARLMLAEAQLAVGDAASALRTVRPLSDSVLAGPRELDLALRAAKAAGDPMAATIAARLQSPQLKLNQQFAATGQAAFNRQDWKAALAAYGQIPGHENDAEVLRRMAAAAVRTGDTDAAIGYADRALAMAPRNADMLHTAALVRLEAGRDREQMLRLMREASHLDPANRLFRADLARAVAAAG